MKYQFLLNFIESNFKAILKILGAKKEEIDELFIINNRDTSEGKSFIASCCKSVFLSYSVVTFVLGLFLFVTLGVLGFESLGFYLYWFLIIYPLAMAFLSFIKEFAASDVLDIKGKESKYIYNMVNIDLVVSLVFSMAVLLVICLLR